MSPHPDDFDRPVPFQHLIDQPALNVDPPGVSTGKVSYQFFIRRRILVRIFAKDFEEYFGFRPKTCCRKFLGVFLGLAGKNDFPTYHRSFSLHFPRGVFNPFRMDSRIPGIETRYSVS